MRAVAVKDYLLQTYHITLSSKDILMWCRGNGHAPLAGSEASLRVVPLPTKVKEIVPTLYCKYCGSPHFPVSDFARLETACGTIINERIASKQSQKDTGTMIYNEDMDVDIECIDDDTRTPPGLYKVKVENFDDASQTAEEYCKD